MAKPATASATTSEMFVPLRATLCTREGQDEVFSIYFSSKPRLRAERELTKVKGRIKLLLQAQEPPDKKKTLSLTCFVYNDDPDWNLMLDYCVQENLVNEDAAEAAKI
jgi:hypothetical protein